MTDAFIADGSVAIVDLQSAQAVLSGSLNAYERAVETFDANDQVEQYKIILRLTITLVDQSIDSTLWELPTVVEGVYDADTEAEEDGLVEAADRLVETVLAKTTRGGW